MQREINTLRQKMSQQRFVTKRNVLTSNNLTLLSKLTRRQIWMPLAGSSGRLCWGCSACCLRCTRRTCRGTPAPADTASHTPPWSRCCWPPCGWSPPGGRPPPSQKPSLALPDTGSQTCSASRLGDRFSRKNSLQSLAGAGPGLVWSPC